MTGAWLCMCAAALFVLAMFAASHARAEVPVTRDHVLERLGLIETNMALFAAGDFADLDKAMNQAQLDYEKGKWSDRDLWRLFWGNLAGPDPEFEKAFDKWVEAYPRSYAARVERGAYYALLAQSAAGKEKAKSEDFTAHAISDEVAALKLAEKPMAADVILIAIDMPSSPDQSRKMLDLADKIDPSNSRARYQYMLELGIMEAAYPGRFISRMQNFAAEVRKALPDANKADWATRPYAARLLDERRYKELDREMNGFQRDYEDGKIDDVTLSQVFSTFNNYDPALEAKFDEWVTEYPGSYAAREARSSYYLQSAQTARGSQRIGDTSANEIDNMNLYLKKALDDSYSAQTLSKKPTLALANAIDIMMYVGCGTTCKAIVEKADAIDPKNYVVRHSYMFSLQGRWNGSLRQMEDFMKDVKASGMRGDRVLDFEDLILTEKEWLEGRADDNISKIGQLVTGF